MNCLVQLLVIQLLMIDYVRSPSHILKNIRSTFNYCSEGNVVLLSLNCDDEN